MRELGRQDRLDRALAALLGVALGDALGMPTQTFSQAEISAQYGVIADFTQPVPEHPVAKGLPAASITDDTEQTLLLAEMILASPKEFNEHVWAQALLDWETDVKRRNLYDLLGPSTKSALEDLSNGIAASETGKYGSTNGAAMRITPIGISTPSGSLRDLVDRVEMVCRVTHNTAEAIASASAVAAAVSAGIDGATIKEAIEIAIGAARHGERRGFDRNTVDISTRIENAVSIVDDCPAADACQAIAKQIGTDVASRESVPAAFALLRLYNGDAWATGIASANLGGDTDTIGSIAAGMCGACTGLVSFPDDKIEVLQRVNQLELEPVARKLIALREDSRGFPVELGQAS